MDMILLAILCGILANELFAWGPRLSDLLLKIAVNRMPLKLQERMQEEWQAHLNALPGGLSKLSATACFLLSTFWGFRRYREDETPVEIEERIALEVALALNQERARISSALESALEMRQRVAKANVERTNKAIEELERRLRWNRTRLVKRRVHEKDPDRSSATLPPYRYKTTMHKDRTGYRTSFF